MNYKEFEKNPLQDIIWGNRFFVNAQFAVGLIAILGKYIQTEIQIEKVFAYAQAVHEQKNVSLYLDVKKGIGEILELEKALQNNILSIEDKKVMDFVIKNVIRSFTNTMIGEK